MQRTVNKPKLVSILYMNENKLTSVTTLLIAINADKNNILVIVSLCISFDSYWEDDHDLKNSHCIASMRYCVNLGRAVRKPVNANQD